MKTAIFPGSFDPFTIGHADIVRRALPLFDSIIIAVGINHQKTPFFPLEKRLESIKRAFADEPRVSVVAYTELTFRAKTTPNLSSEVFAPQPTSNTNEQWQMPMPNWQSRKSRR